METKRFYWDCCGAKIRVTSSQISSGNYKKCSYCGRLPPKKRLDEIIRLMILRKL